MDYYKILRDRLKTEFSAEDGKRTEKALEEIVNGVLFLIDIVEEEKKEIESGSENEKLKNAHHTRLEALSEFSKQLENKIRPALKKF